MKKIKKVTKKRLLWASALTTAVALVAYYYYTEKKATPTPEVAPVSPTPIPNVAVAKTLPAGSFPLKIGDRNMLVRELQTALGISADGIFGKQTEAALKARGMNTTVSVTDLNRLKNPTLTANADLVKKHQALLERFQNVLLSNSWGKWTQLKSVFDVLKTPKDRAEFAKAYQSVYGESLQDVLSRYNEVASKQILNSLQIAQAANLQGIDKTVVVLGSNYALVRDSKGNTFQVPPSTVLGKEIAVKQGIVAFESGDKKIGYVDANQVRVW